MSLALVLLVSIGLTSCASHDDPAPQQPAPALVEALESHRIEPDALTQCNDRAPGDYVSAFATSTSAIRDLVRAGQEDAAGLDRLPEGSDSVVCIARNEDEAGRQIVVASWIAWGPDGNSPTGFVEIFCDQDGVYALAEECLAG